MKYCAAMDTAGGRREYTQGVIASKHSKCHGAGSRGLLFKRLLCSRRLTLNTRQKIVGHDTCRFACTSLIFISINSLCTICAYVSLNHCIHLLLEGEASKMVVVVNVK